MSMTRGSIQSLIKNIAKNTPNGTSDSVRTIINRADGGSIPAALSEGEFVFDAETVALVGNGSSEAGAKILEQVRQSIRKMKGKNLVKGKQGKSF